MSMRYVPAIRVLFAVALAACGGDGGGSNAPTGPSPTAPTGPASPAPVASVNVSPENATVTAGDTVRLKATAWDAAGREVSGVTFAWTSSDAATATVAASGLVTAIAPGEARITVTVNDKQGTARLTATPRTFAHGTIAFVSERHGSPEIYLIGRAGERRLTDNAIPERNVAWSPDGSRIAFEVAVGGPLRGIWVINADGGGLTRVTNPPERNVDFSPQWSPDGGRIAYVRGVNLGSEIRLVNADGTSDVRLTGGSGTTTGNPTWSSDGQRIAFTAFPTPTGPVTVRSDIYVINADGTGLTNLTNTPAASDEWPIWSSDGRKIVFIGYPEGARQIYAMNPDGSDIVRLTATQWSEDAAAWSPDSRRIAFRSSRDRALVDLKEVYMMNADGSAQARLTTMRWSVDLVLWSPDGTRLIFAASLENASFTAGWDRWDRPHIYMLTADGSTLTRVTGAGTSDYSPAWRP